MESFEKEKEISLKKSTNEKYKIKRKSWKGKSGLSVYSILII